MADFDLIKRNISKMIEQNAPESDIDDYVADEGVTAEQIRAYQPPPQQIVNTSQKESLRDDRRGMIVPARRNPLTNEMEWAVPTIVKSAAEAAYDAFKLPGDVLSGKRQITDPETGEITQDAIGSALNFGLTVSPLGAASRAKQLAPKPTVQKITGTKNINNAANFGVDLSRGQATRDFKAQTFEQDALTGGHGDGAQRLISGMRDAQSGQVDEAVEAIIKGQSGSKVGDSFEAADNVGSAVMAQSKKFKQQAKKSYSDAEREGGDILHKAVSELSNNLTKTLDDVGALEGTLVAPDMPTVRRIMQRVDALSKMKNAPSGDVTGVNWKAFEAVRKSINSARPMGEEGRVLGKLKGSLDEWMQKSIDAGLISGSPKFIDDLKKGRFSWSQYKSINNNPKKIIQNMADGGADSVQIANWLYGSTRVGGRADSASVVREISKIIGANNPAMDDLRRGTLERLFKNTLSGERKTYAKLASDIQFFTNGNGRELSKELFGKDGVEQLNKFSKILRTLTPDDIATNPSRSGQTVSRRVMNALTKVAPFVGFAAGDMTGLLAGFGFASASKSAAKRKAREFIENPSQVIKQQSAPVGVGQKTSLLGAFGQSNNHRRANAAKMFSNETGIY